MNKIQMNKIVEMDGDEMTRILWSMIKEQLLSPFIQLNTEYYDLGLPNRDKTNDQVTIDAANACKKYHVAVKCATITPNKQRVEEYHLKQMWKSPNATIRGVLDGTVFRTPIIVNCIKPYVQGWTKPITIARHAYGDIYKSTEYRVNTAGTATLSFKGNDGTIFENDIFTFNGPGVIQGQYNKDDSIISFANSCFQYAIDTKQDLWFSTKDTISKQYDQTFKLIFQDIFERKYKEKFEQLGITYFYTLIDDAVARIMKSNGGFIWACKNYDGDVMSDMISAGFGSLAMMRSVLVSPNGDWEYEAAHGTITRHYYRYQNGETTSSNPVATIFAWSGALKKRGELDDNLDLINFASHLEQATIKTIESGIMTKDLAILSQKDSVDSLTFIKQIRSELEKNYK